MLTIYIFLFPSPILDSSCRNNLFQVGGFIGPLIRKEMFLILRIRHIRFERRYFVLATCFYWIAYNFQSSFPVVFKYLMSKNLNCVLHLFFLMLILVTFLQVDFYSRFISVLLWMFHAYLLEWSHNLSFFYFSGCLVFFSKEKQLFDIFSQQTLVVRSFYRTILTFVSVYIKMCLHFSLQVYSFL